MWGGVEYFHLSSEALGRTSVPEENQDSGVTGAQDAEPGLHPNSLPQYVTGYSLSCTCSLIYKEDRVVKLRVVKAAGGLRTGTIIKQYNASHLPAVPGMWWMWGLEHR